MTWDGTLRHWAPLDGHSGTDWDAQGRIIDRFVSSDAAAKWLALDPEGEVVSVDEDFEVTRLPMSLLGSTSIGSRRAS
jgi:hypothetical protein